jgi:hypothetical protein
MSVRGINSQASNRYKLPMIEQRKFDTKQKPVVMSHGPSFMMPQPQRHRELIRFCSGAATEKSEPCPIMTMMLN